MFKKRACGNDLNPAFLSNTKLPPEDTAHTISASHFTVSSHRMFNNFRDLLHLQLWKSNDVMKLTGGVIVLLMEMVVQSIVKILKETFN